MEDVKDIRWTQRFSNFEKALKQLEKAVNQYNDKGLSDLEKQGLIQGFEFTHELAWKTLKDFLEEKGNVKIYGSKDATKEAFNKNIIFNGEAWMEMIKDRNLSSHAYDEATADKIVIEIVDVYYDEFVLFQKKMKEIDQLKIDL